MTKEEKPLIIIGEPQDVVEGQVQGDVPVIIVERDPEGPSNGNGPRRRWWVLGSMVLTIGCCLLAWLGWRYYRALTDIGVPIAVTSEQNIELLSQASPRGETAGVEMLQDTVLGVAFNMYRMTGLRAEITMQEPDTTDMDVYLYSRCSDYHPDFSVIGTLVMNGKVMPSVQERRLGYFAGANGNYVIGVARDEQVRDYVARCEDGCMFRQYILVSDGVLPPRFYLHGKVERRGLGRLANGELRYIETCNAETMWDFADALREYGFVDAIYITGGRDYCFYRTADGQRHDLGNVDAYPHKNEGRVPWVVFRAR